MRLATMSAKRARKEGSKQNMVLQSATSAMLVGIVMVVPKVHLTVASCIVLLVHSVMNMAK